MIFFRFAAIAIFGLSSAASVLAQNRESTLAALTKLVPAERQARMIEGAKKENGLVWYSSTTAEDALALTKKFHEHYPNIQINHFRSSSEKLLERILAEARANAFKEDIVSLPELEPLDHDQTETFDPVRAAGKFNLSAREQRSARLLDGTLHLCLGARA